MIAISYHILHQLGYSHDSPVSTGHVAMSPRDRLPHHPSRRVSSPSRPQFASPRPSSRASCPRGVGASWLKILGCLRKMHHVVQRIRKSNMPKTCNKYVKIKNNAKKNTNEHQLCKQKCSCKSVLRIFLHFTVTIRYLGFSIFVQNHVCPVGSWSDLHVSRIFGYLSFVFLYMSPFFMVVSVRIALFNSILRHWFSVLHVFQYP